MATFNLSGTPSQTNLYGSGVLTLPAPQSVREKIRIAVSYGLTQIQKVNGYYTNIGEVLTQMTAFDKRKNFPSVTPFWDREIYTNGSAGGNTLKAYEKIADLIITAYFNENDNPEETRENYIADVEKYFGANPSIPDSLGNNTCFSCMLSDNRVFGMENNEPRIGVDMTLRIWYRIDLDNPNLAV